MVLNTYNKIKEFIFGKGIGGERARYLIVGGLTTLINFGLFTLLNEIMGVDSTVSNLISIPVSILFAYIANKLAVFRRHSGSIEELAAEFCKFVGSRLFTMAIDVGVVFLFDNVLSWNATVGKAISQVIVIVVNYIISKALVFRLKD